jgi:hypothetical protein
MLITELPRTPKELCCTLNGDQYPFLTIDFYIGLSYAEIIF